MEAIYLAVENAFVKLANLIYRFPVPFLLLVIAATVLLSSQLSKLTLDTSNESFFHADSPLLLNYRAFWEEFGREDMIIIAMEAENVFEQAFLERLASLHEALEAEVPHLDDVTSLLNARNTRGEGDELIVEDLFDEWPEDSDAMSALKQRAMANPIYRDLLLSADGHTTAIVVRATPYAPAPESSEVLDGFDDNATGGADKAEFLDDTQSAEFVAVARAVVERFDTADFPLQVSGMPVMTEVIKQHMRDDMARFVAAALVGIILLLLVMFRRLSGVLLPLLTIVLTLVCTLGLMGATGTAFKVPTQILPSFLIAVGVGSSVHILSQFFWRFDESGDRKAALVGAMRQSGAPVVGAAVTTAAGLMSFSNASLAPLAEMGLFAGAGILISLVYTIVMIPALLSLVPVKRRVQASESGVFMDRILAACAHYALRYRRANLLIAALLTVLALAGLARLEFEHDPLAWFPDDHPLRLDTEAINDSLNGVITMEVVVDTGTRNGLYDPALLQTMEGLGQDVMALEYRGMSSEKVLSLADVIKEINLALNADQPQHYKIPDDRKLIAQELFLFENTGTDDLQDFVDSQFQKARYTVKLPWMGSTVIFGFGQELLRVVDQALPAGVTANLTGISTLFATISVESLISMRESYVIAAVLISVLMVVFIGDIKVGLIAMIPNLSPILIALGLLGWSGIPLNVFTMFVGSIALGLAVDDTLHFLHGFKRAHIETGNTQQAILRTFMSTGRALIVTTVALAFGFFLFAFATMQSVVLFGILTGSTIVLALVADFILVPALLTMIVPDQDTLGATDSEEVAL